MTGNPDEKQNSDGFETYQTVAETVGLVPSLRLKDNLIQALIVIALTSLSVIVGFFYSGSQGALIGAAVGLVGSFLISGTVLMILGWVRTAKKMK